MHYLDQISQVQVIKSRVDVSFLSVQAFKSASQEMSRILDIVGCYAIFAPEVGFTVKKQASFILS